MALDLSTLPAQLAGATLLASLWAVIYEVAVPSVKRHVKRAAWWPGAVKQVKSMMYGFGYPKSPTASFEEGTSDEMAAEFYAWVAVTCGQHVLSCLLILPVLCLGWQRSGGAVRTAFILGTLNDVGFDLYDAAKKVLTLPLVRRKVPSLQRLSDTGCPEKFCFVAVALHHVLALSLMLPMNLRYPHLASYHRICAALLGAAGLCYLLILYKFTVDAGSRSGLLLCKAISVLQFLTVSFTRGLIWFTQAWAALAHFHSRGDRLFLMAGCACALLMSAFNVLMLLDATKAVAKWAPKRLPTVSRAIEQTVEAAAKQASGLAAEVMVEEMLASTNGAGKDRMTIRRTRESGCRARFAR